MHLRNYQGRFKNDLLDAFKQHRAVLGVCPTGGGKTYVFSDMVSEFNGASSIIAHRKEIVAQISSSLGRFDVPHRIIGPRDEVARIRREHLEEFGRSFVVDNAPVGVASVQTLTSRSAKSDQNLNSWLRQVRFAVFDEAHHYVKQGQWGSALELFNKARILGVTATPERADGKGLGLHADGFAEVMVEGPTTQWLIEQGHLSKFIYKAPASDFDISDIPVTKSGDVNTKVLRQRVEASHIVGDCVTHYKNYTPGRRAIVFVPDVKTAHETADAFNRSNIPAIALSGETDNTTRARSMQDFKAGALRVLVNVDLFDEGLDVPAVEAVFLMRYTKSVAKFLQMCGRGLRKAEGKEHVIICDMVRNWLEHGPFHLPRTWSLDKRETRGRSGPSDTIDQRVCVACTQPYEAFYDVCPYCANPYVREGNRTIAQVDGVLTDLDFEALEQIIKDVRRANLAGNDFEYDMIKRRVPGRGKGVERKRRKTVLYRREILRELMAFWMAAHPQERSTSERYARFYHFFGVDMYSAGALNAAETDALCDTMARRFTESITR